MSTKYIVNFSTGLSSFWALKRTLESKGRENTIAVFSDVKGDPARDPHTAPAGTNWDGEDDDNYRFLADAERLLDFPIQRISHPNGLGVWGIIFRERAIKVAQSGNYFYPCTAIAKGEALDTYAAQWPNCIRVAGLQWDEDDRIEKSLRYNPDQWFPLTEAPFVNNCFIISWLAERGVKPPHAYSQGYPHANCGGACIKAGQSQWAALLRDNPGRYRYNETQEELFRAEINPDVAILRDRRGGKLKALPLSQFREEIEAGVRKAAKDDWGGCGCFSSSPQVRMAQIALEPSL